MTIKANWLASTLLVSFCMGTVLQCYADAAMERVSGNSKAELVGKVKEQAILTNGNDGSKILEQLKLRVKQLGSYHFDGLLATMKEAKLHLDAGSFFYKPQACLRVEVKGHGFKAGSVLVKKDGVIKAKGGPALLGMKITLEPDSTMLRLPNGFNIVECDFISLFAGLERQIATGQKIYSSESPMQIDSQSNKVLVLETREAGQNPGTISQRILVDPKLLVPVEWDIFKNGKFFSTVRFENFQASPAIDESAFQL